MYTAAANHPVRLHRLEKRQRRGSLPLKKRRVSVDLEFAVHGSSNSSSPFFAYQKPANLQKQTLTLLPSQSLLQNNHHHHHHHRGCGLETLAASASACSFGHRNTNLNDDTTRLKALSLIAAAAVASQKEASSLEASSLSSNEDGEEEEQEIILSTAEEEESTSHQQPGNSTASSSSSGSIAHQTVCQHKNCQRVAGYQNSDFCKMHARSQGDNKSYKKTSKHHHSNVATSTIHPPVTTTGQDKRYTGEEARCCATTTRGRACAYIAVNDTKYCHMHADYDSNPPPRRGIKSPTPTVSNSSLEINNNSKHSSPKKQSSSITKSSGSSGKSNKSHNNWTTQKNTKEPMSPLPATASPRRSAANRAEKHADSPYPLLSMISTDQWFQRKVQVAVGPLQGRIGTVQKWGNGWISVKIPGVAGLHNRRSIELYLQENGEQQQQQQQAKVVDKKAAKKRKAKSDPPAEAMGLFRCISRDVDVVSPSPSTDQSIRSGRSMTPKLAPSARRNSKFSPLPETPTPSGSNHNSSVCNSFLSPVPQKATAAPPKVTPLLNEDAKPVVSFKSKNCDRLQLPVTTTSTMKDSVSSNKSMVFRPSATTDLSSNT